MQTASIHEGASETQAGVGLFDDFVGKLLRRWRLFLSVFLIVVTFGFLLSFLPRRYRATAQLRIQPSAEKVFSITSAANLGNADDTEIATEAIILGSRTLLLQVAKELNLASDPAFWGKKEISTNHSLDDPAIRDAVAVRMKGKISIVHVPKAQVINIEVTTSSPQLSSRIANTLIDDYIARVFQMRFGATDRVSKWIITQLSDLRKQVEDDQSQLVVLQGKLGLLGVDPKNITSLQAESLNQLNQAASEAQVERIVAEARYRYIKDMDPTLIEGSPVMLGTRNTTANAVDSFLESLRSTKAQLGNVYAEQSTKYGPNYPETKQTKAQLDAVDREIKTEEERVIRQSELAYKAALTNERATSAAVDLSRSGISARQGDMVRLSLLEEDYESHRALYSALVQRLQEAGIDAGLDSAKIDVVDLADVPSTPAPPGRRLLLLAGAFGGIVFGVAAVLLVSGFDTTLHQPEDIERASGLTLLAMLPHVDMSKSDSRNMSQPYLESIQHLRSSLLLAGAGGNPRVILLTSSIEGEGKSTTVLHLAMMLARYNSKVLLVDADLRRGRQAQRLGLPNRIGLSSLLSGIAGIDEAIQPVAGLERLSMIASGPVPPLPAALLNSDGMTGLLAQMRTQFDFILLDSTPALAVADAANLARGADAVVMVTRQHRTKLKTFGRAVELMTRASGNIVGFVLNDMDTRLNQYGYYNSYNYTSGESSQ